MSNTNLRRIRLPRIRNFGDDSIPMHAQASHSRSQYDNSEEDYSMSDIQVCYYAIVDFYF